MRIQYLFTILLSFSTLFQLFAQERTPIQGQIIIDLEDESTEGVQIVNMNTLETIEVNETGVFNLSLKLNDVLHISSYDYEERKYTVSQKDIDSKELEIHLNVTPNLIDEVVVNQLKFTGDLAKDVKHNRDQLKSYKQQQILAKVKPTDLSTGELTPLNIGGSYRSKFKGHTGAQKKREEALSYRGELETQNQIQNYFHEEFYTNTLHIPQEEITNFIAYCFAKSNIKDLARINEFTKIQLALIDLAPQYIARMKNAEKNQSSSTIIKVFNLS